MHDREPPVMRNPSHAPHVLWRNMQSVHPYSKAKVLTLWVAVAAPKVHPTTFPASLSTGYTVATHRLPLPADCYQKSPCSNPAKSTQIKQSFSESEALTWYCKSLVLSPLGAVLVDSGNHCSPPSLSHTQPIYLYVCKAKR